MTAGTAGAPPFRRAAGGTGARAEAVMWGLFVAAGLFAVVAALDLVDVLRVVAELPALEVGRVAAGQGLGVTEMVMFWVLLVAYAVWFRMTVSVVRGLDQNPREVLLRTPMTLWQVCAGVTLVTAVLLPHADLMGGPAFGERLRWMAPILAVRLALALLLVPVVLGLRRRVYATMLRSGVASLPRPEERMTLLELTKRAAQVVPPLPVAGDAWWSEVAEQVAAAGTALELRESAGPDDERVLLVEPGTDLTALRASLRPGATLTLLSDDALTAAVPG